MMHDDANVADTARATREEPGVIYLVREDHERLVALVEGHASSDAGRRDATTQLEEELDRAVVVAGSEVPADTVTLDSWVRLMDLDSEEELLVSPVLPSRAKAEVGRISVLAPLGTAVLGYRAGDTIEWRVPGGLRRLRVLSVMYQPEAHARQSEERVRRGAEARPVARRAARRAR